MSTPFTSSIIVLNQMINRLKPDLDKNDLLISIQRCIIHTERPKFKQKQQANDTHKS